MVFSGKIYVYIFSCAVLLLADPSLSYIQLTLENGKVCSVVRKQELKMKVKEESGIIVKELRYFDNWSGIYPFNCNFSVVAPRPFGIVAVIQNLVLRQNETTGECIDYVQFHRHERKNVFRFPEVFRSQRYCGKVNIFRDPSEYTEPDSQSLVPADNAFIDPNGRLDVTIYVAGLRLVPTESLDVSIAFTAYLPCKDSEQSSDYRNCHPRSGICIWEGFFNDKIVNCPFNDCMDEGGCPILSQGGKRGSSGLGTKVTIGAVVAILSLLLLFLLCLFVCRHCKVLCWANTVQRHNSTPPSNRVEMTSHVANTSDDVEVQPSAPPLLSASSPTSPVHEDKDLPPPYESLFPSR